MSTPNGPRHRTGDWDHRLHDVDLVAAYAGEDPGIDRDRGSRAGRNLPGMSRPSSSSSVTSPPGCRRLPAVVMSDDERIAAPSLESTARSPGRMWFRFPIAGPAASPVRSSSGIGTAAAALAVIAGIGGVFEHGGDNDGGHAFQTSRRRTGRRRRTSHNSSSCHHDDHHGHLCGRIRRRERCWLAEMPRRSRRRSKT